MRKLMDTFCGLALGAALSLPAAALAAEGTRDSNAAALAAQPSLWERNEVWIIFEEDLDPALAGGAGNFLLQPPHRVVSATPHPDAANVVRLELCPLDPLEADTVYTVRLAEGGEDFDPYYSHTTFTARSLPAELRHILGTQLPDGAIAINRSRETGWVRGVGVRIVPYFACMSAVALVKGYSITGDEQLLAAVRDYVDWHVAHFNEDDTINDYRGTYPNYPSTGDYDSTDSYGSLFIYLLWQYYMHTGDAGYIEAHYPNVLRAVNAIELTMEEDNLTWAKPQWHIKYTMDNVEVFQGYSAAAQIARVLGRTEDFAAFADKADKTREAVLGELYFADADPPRFSVGKDNGGEIFGGWEVYYPDGMANDFVLAYLLPAGDERAAAAWSEGRSLFLRNNLPADDVEFFMSKAAHRHDDTLAYLLATARGSAKHARSDWSFNSGHLIRLAHQLRGYTAKVPLVEDASRGSVAWDQAMRLPLHPLGEALEADNRQVSRFDFADGFHVASLLRDGEGLALSVESYPDPRLADAGDAARVAWKGQLRNTITGESHSFVIALEDSAPDDPARVQTGFHRFPEGIAPAVSTLELSVTETAVDSSGSIVETTLSVDRGRGELLTDAAFPPSILKDTLIKGGGFQ